MFINILGSIKKVEGIEAVMTLFRVTGVAISIGLTTSQALAQVLVSPPDPTSEQRRQSDRDRATREKQEPRIDAPSEIVIPVSPLRLPASEVPCFEIRRIDLIGDKAEHFQWILSRLNGDSHDDSAKGKCIGAHGINALLKRTQDVLIAKGFVTSRILAEPQDLKAGNLVLTIIPGRVRAIRFANEKTRTPSVRNALPITPEDVLNLRDIEQGLENFKRIPSAEVDIKIEPAEGSDAKPGYSDLVINYTQNTPFRFSLSADDSGTKGSGKYQGGITISYDNWWAISDLLYISFNHDLGGGQEGPRGTKANTLHYSIPFGYWTIGATASRSRYFQTIAGATQEYIYSGTSANTEIKLARLVYRDAQRKTTLSLRAFQRKSNNYIDDTEVQVQERIVGGWEASVNHREFVNNATIDASMAYKRGTGAFGSLPAPEEAFGEGTSRFALVIADVNLAAPFTIGEKKLRYSNAWRIQANRTPLTPQDRFAIGSRYTVRGFDGENSLSAERGWYMRNEIALPVGASQQELYLGLDHGRVGGASSKSLLGKKLTGAVLGLRGALLRIQYELFIASPVHKPDGYKSDGTTAGFNLNYSY